MQQSAGIRQITDAMQSVAEGGNNTAATAVQLEDAVANLTRVGDDLRCFIVG